ncbi:MAG TPA: DUF488 family protein [Paenalcaligenes sp.]|nr:DUF488 family protein [Paenalcaligenes sp.]
MSTGKEPQISLEQIYAVIKQPVPVGHRVLTDRLWPRGLKKTQLEEKKITWYRGASPSTELRKAFHAKDLNVDEFNQAYQKQLKSDPDQLKPLVELAEQGPLTLLTAMRNPADTYLSVLAELIRAQLKA